MKSGRPLSVILKWSFSCCMLISITDTTNAPADNSCAFTAIKGLEKVIQCPSASSCPNITSITWCVTRIVPELVGGDDPFEVCVSRIGVVHSEGTIPSAFTNGGLVVDDEGLLNVSASTVVEFKLYDRINCSVINETTGNICDETSGINLTVISQASFHHYPETRKYDPCEDCTVTAGQQLLLCMMGVSTGVSMISSTHTLPSPLSSKVNTTSLTPINITGRTDCNRCTCDDMNLFKQFINDSSTDDVHVFVNLGKSQPCQLIFDMYEFYLLIPRTSSQTAGEFELRLYDNKGVSEKGVSELPMSFVGFNISVVYKSIIPIFHSPMNNALFPISENSNIAIPCNVTVSVGVKPMWAGPDVIKLNSSSCSYEYHYADCVCENHHSKDSGVYSVDAISKTVFGSDKAELARRVVALVICKATPTLELNYFVCTASNINRSISIQLISAASTPPIIATPIINFTSTNATPIITSISTISISHLNNVTSSTVIDNNIVFNHVVLSFVIVFSLLAAILTVLIIVVVTCRFMLQHSNQTEGGAITLADKLEFSRDQLIFVEKKGEGQFGEVWKAIAPGIVPGNQARNVVAVKHVKESASWTESNMLQEELEIMKTIEPHPNVVNLLGYCTLPTYSPILIIMEFAEHGNLKDYLVSLRHMIQIRPSDSASQVSSPFNHSAPTEMSSLPYPSRSSTPAVLSSDEDSFIMDLPIADNVCQCSDGRSLQYHSYINVAMEIPDSEPTHDMMSFCTNYYNLIQDGVSSCGDIRENNNPIDIVHVEETELQSTPTPPPTDYKDGCGPLGNNRETELPPLLSNKFIIESALQIAKGMKHLEEMKCLHRDLAARNILIADGFLLKVSDFGLARDASDKDYYRRLSSNRLPVCWMAIESLDSEKIHTHKSDVWSFAVVLWEIHTYGKHPYGSHEVASTCESILDYLKEGNRLPRPDHCTDQMFELMTECWDVDPSKRPSFSNIVLKLDQLLSIEHGYLALSEQQNSAAVFDSISDPACQLSINAVQSSSCSRSHSRSPFHILSHSLNSIPHVTPVPCLDDSNDSNQVSHFPFSSTAAVTRHSLSPFAIVSPFSNNSSETLKSRSHSQSRSHSPFPPPLSPFFIEPIMGDNKSGSHSTNPNTLQPHSYSSLPPLHSLSLNPDSNNNTANNKARSHSPNPVPESTDQTTIPVSSLPRPSHTQSTTLSLPRLSSSRHVTSSSRSPSPRITIEETSFHCTVSEQNTKNGTGTSTGIGTVTSTGIGTVTSTGTGTSTGTVTNVVYSKKPLTRT